MSGGKSKGYSIIDNRHFKLIKTVPGQNNTTKLIAKCLLCTSEEKRISADTRSESNFKTHLKRAHAEAFQALEEEKNKKFAGNKQPTLTKYSTGVTLGKQKLVDRLILNYIVKGMRPLSTVVEEGFRDLIKGLAGLSGDSNIQIMSRDTLGLRIKSIYNDEVLRLCQLLQNTQYLSLTADAWSSHSRSFLGVTAHWINQDFSRGSAVLTCARFKGTQSFDRIAKALNEVMDRFGIKQRVVCIVTDNGTNFIKAFKVFGKDFDEELEDQEPELPLVSDMDSDSEAEMDGEEEEILTEVSVSKILENNADDATDSITLPPHIRCASHCLNLVATSDIKTISKQGTYFRATEKAKKLWILSAKPKSAEIIDEISGSKFIRPGCTRWNGTYDALKRVLDLERFLKDICVKLNLVPFTEKELEFLHEFVRISKPIADALDLLQGEKGTFLGTLLPTITKLIQILEGERQNTKHCQQFIDAYLVGIRTRFQRVLAIDPDQPSEFVFAAVSHPFYKLRWLPVDMRAKIKAKFIEECAKYCTETQTGASAPAVPSTEPKNLLLDFSEFEIQIPTNTTTEGQVVDYLNNPSLELNLLDNQCYKLIKQVFCRYNTGLPSSAPVERLFSYAGMILTKTRCCLKDKMFEVLVFLKYNWLQKN